MIILPKVLAEALPVGAGDVKISDIHLNNAERGSLRFKAAVAGTLKFRYLRPDANAEYDEAPADVPVLINDEVAVLFSSLTGESALRVIFNSVGGVVTYADWSATYHA